MAACFLLATSSSVASASMQISSSGAILAGSHRHVQEAEVPAWAQILKMAKDGLARTHHGVSTLMRSEVRPHSPVAHDKVVKRKYLDDVIGLMEIGQVNCSSSSESDPTGKLCRLLYGTNSQVAGKLERAVKGLSLRPKSANATEMIVADKGEDKELILLKAAMWDMYFCAKRESPPCDLMSSAEPKIKAARDKAFAALQAIHVHATPLAAVDATAAAATAQPAAAAVQSPGSLLEQPGGGSQPAGQTMTADKWAAGTLDMLITGDNITGKLWDAIHMCDVDVAMQDGMVKLEDDEDGNLKKLKANMLILHECASMPDCETDDQGNVTATVANCCHPFAPTQEKYAKARNDAYIAYHDVGEDDELAKRTYIKILENVGNTPPGANYMPASKVDIVANLTKEVEVVYEPGHPLYAGNDTKKEAELPPIIIEEDNSGSTLMMAIIVVTGVVLAAVGFLIYKTKEMDDKGASGEAGYDEGWGEGYGEGEGYGQY